MSDEATLEHGIEAVGGWEKRGDAAERIGIFFAESIESVYNAVEEKFGVIAGVRNNGEVEIDAERFGVNFGLDERFGTWSEAESGNLTITGDLRGGAEQAFTTGFPGVARVTDDKLDDGAVLRTAFGKVRK